MARHYPAGGPGLRRVARHLGDGLAAGAPDRSSGRAGAARQPGRGGGATALREPGAVGCAAGGVCHPGRRAAGPGTATAMSRLTSTLPVRQILVAGALSLLLALPLYAQSTPEVLHRADSAFAAEDRALAAQLYRQVLESNPDQSRAVYRLGVLSH